MSVVWVGKNFVHCDNATQHFEQMTLWTWIMWIVIIWEIWNHKNKIIFNNGVVDPIEIFAMV